MNARPQPAIDTFPVRNPFNGKTIGMVPVSDDREIHHAIAKARMAWSEFRFSTPFERKSLLEALATEISRHAEDLATTICREVGKTISEARNEVRRAQNTLRLSGQAATSLIGEMIPCAVVEGAPDRWASVTYEPAGVVAAITPFNYPLNLLCHKLGPAIAAGNAVVAKPSPKAPLAAAMLAELAQTAGFPDGLFTIVHGGNRQALLLAGADIDLLSFTGGPEAGLALKNASGIVRCLMELGGNDPLIVMADADLEKAAKTAVAQRFEIAGQSCAAVKKLYLHESIRGEMIKRIGERIAGMTSGDPEDPDVDMGPVIDEDAATEVSKRISSALDDGATRIIGSERTGNVIAPTLLDNVSADSDIFARETFGPVLAVRTFGDADQVLRELESSPYGLQAGIFSNDNAAIRKFSRRLRVGGVMVNEGPDFRAENVPFGGFKKSGLGREGVGVTLREMSELKVVIE